MMGKLFVGEADCQNKYYKFIQTKKKYADGKEFPIDEIVEASRPVNLEAENPIDMGGFCVSIYENAFRWVVRGDTLCEVLIPEGEKIYTTGSDNGIYIAQKIILTNPKKVDDEFAMQLYLNSKLPEKSYFLAMTACAICGYIKTALQVCLDKVNSENVEIAITELDDFCKRRMEEKYIENASEIETIKILRNKLLEIKKENPN